MDQDRTVPNPDAKKTKRFALSLMGGAFFGATILFLRGKPHWRWIAAGGFCCGLISYLWPAFGYRFHRLLNAIAAILAITLTSAILAILYYAFFSPLALLLRLVRKNSLNLKPCKAESFWIALPESGEDEKIKYERLY